MNNLLKELSEVLQRHGTKADFKVVDKTEIVIDFNKDDEIKTRRITLNDFIFALNNYHKIKNTPVESEVVICDHPLDKRFWGKNGGKCLQCGRLFFN